MGMRHCSIARRVPVAAFACAALACCLALASPAAAQRRILYLDYVGNVGSQPAHNHPSRVNAAVAMQALAAASGGAFTVDRFTNPDGLNAAFLAQYDALVFFTCGDLAPTAPLRQALFDFVAGGKGFVGFHSAADSFYSWPEYGTFIGGRFVNHGSDNQPGTIRVEDPGPRGHAGLQQPVHVHRRVLPVPGSRVGYGHAVHAWRQARPDDARSGHAHAGAARAANGVPAARWQRPAARLDAAARRRPHVLLEPRASAGDLGQPAVPRPRAGGDPLGARRRRRRRPRRSLGDGLRTAQQRRHRPQRRQRRSRRRRPHQPAGAGRQHASARLRQSLPGGRGDQQLLRDEDRRAEPQPDLQRARAAPLPDGQRRRADGLRRAGAAVAPDDDAAERRRVLDAGRL